METHNAFAPVVDERVRVLILGSLPGAESLRAGRYYANPRNAFWRLASDLAGRDLVPASYPARLAALLEARIGLWDVIASARRRGSLDADIRAARHADIGSLVERLPDLRAIGFNGRKASISGRPLLRGLARQPELIDLPSSSPAYAGMSLVEKTARWSVLKDHLV